MYNLRVSLYLEWPFCDNSTVYRIPDSKLNIHFLYFILGLEWLKIIHTFRFINFLYFYFILFAFEWWSYGGANALIIDVILFTAKKDRLASA